MSIEDTLKTLNPAQLEAVRYEQGPTLIVAGAGTGKTKTLTTKIAKLIADGYNPRRILAVTFTNKAAQEMRERVEALMPGMGRSVWIHTFHSLGVRLLRQHAEKMGLTKDFAIYDDSEQKKVVSLILQQMGVKEPKKEVNQIISLISRAKDDMISADVFMESATATGLDFRVRVAEVYQRYEKKLKEAGALDFGDLLVKTAELLQKNDDVREYYQDFFQYVLVDEYQDTNHTQYMITRMLAEKHRRLCVVGDPDQSIYSWRGANIRNILEFEKDFKDAKIVTLEQNYRSTKVILDASNLLITKNKKRKEKSLFTDKTSGEDIQLRETMTEGQEAVWVSQNIKYLVDEEGLSLNEIAVFYRTNAQSRNFEDTFRRYQIPYRLIGTVRFYDRKEIKDIMCYARILVNSNDNVSLLRIMNTPRRGLGNTAQEKLLEYADANGISLYEAMRSAAYVDGLTPMARRGALELIKMFEGFKADMFSILPSELIMKILTNSGYLKSIDDEIEKDPEALSRKQNLEELVNAVKEYEERCEREGKEPALSDFLQEVSLLTGADDSQAVEGGAVTLMTVHLAKGLEFNAVFVTGLEEGLFPINKESEDELEEERRLCYVAMTRARDRLYMSYSANRRIFGKTDSDRLPSRFLFESGLLDEAEHERRRQEQPRYTDYKAKYGLYGQGGGGRYSGNFGKSKNSYNGFDGFVSRSKFQKSYDKDGYEVDDTDLDYTASSFKGSAGLGSLYGGKPAAKSHPEDYPSVDVSQEAQAQAEPPKDGKVRVGGAVKHGVFGPGKVLSVSGSGENCKITVVFNHGVRRTFMLAFAPLEIL